MSGVGLVQPEKRLGQAIAAARKAAGLTQQDLCARADLSYSTLAKIERGAIKSPSVFTVAAIAGATGKTVEELAGVVAPTPVVPQKQYKTAKNGVKFVFFDVNGVLVRFYQRAFTKIAADTGASADGVEATFWHYNDAVCRGEMTIDEFNSILAKRIGVESIAWQDYYLSSIDQIAESREFLAWTVEHYRVGLLTNIMPTLLREMIAKGLLPDVPYELLVDSSDVGSIKPEPEIYEQAARLTSLEPNQILLVDDSRTNLIAAERLGWRVLWFDDYRPAESIDRIRSALEF